MDRKIIFLCAGAIPLGLAGGYAWATLSAPPAHQAAPRRGTIQQLPRSPEERPGILDEEWTQEAHDGAMASPAQGRTDFAPAVTSSAPRARRHAMSATPDTSNGETATVTVSPASSVVAAD